MEALRVNIVGTGNIAWHLVYMMQLAGVEIQNIYGRDVQKAKSLAEQCNANPQSLTNIEKNEIPSLYFFAVADDAIGEVAEKFNFNNNILVHLSGAVSSEELNFGRNAYGVYYPLQSFSKQVETDYRKIPVCIVSPIANVQETLLKIAHSISNEVSIISDEQKSYLHLAAVFVNNFTNNLYDSAFSILDDIGLSKKYLLPLMEETVHKVSDSTPTVMQTGPARRGDIHTIEKHLHLLKKYPELVELYNVFSKIIQKKYTDN